MYKFVLVRRHNVEKIKHICSGAFAWEKKGNKNVQHPYVCPVSVVSVSLNKGLSQGDEWRPRFPF